VAHLTVRRADYDDPSSLRDALTDVRTLVLISSDGVAESMRRHHEHVIRAGPWMTRDLRGSVGISPTERR
jgi:uncharacterized protein YbjT (DUF2867 family)